MSAPLPSSNLVPLERVAARERQGAPVVKSLVVLHRVGTHQVRQRRWREARSSTSQGRAEPLCARIKGANRQVSEVKADI